MGNHEQAARIEHSIAPEPSLEGTGAYLRLGAWTGLLAGVVALTVLAIKRYTGGLIFYPIETLWREPLSAVVFMTAVAVAFAIGRRVLPGLFHWRLLLWSGLFIGGFNALLRIPGLHWAASAVLSAGIAYQVMRWIARRPAMLSRVMRATLIPGLIAVALTAALIPAQRHWRDRQALRPFDRTGGDAPNVLLLVLDTVRSWNLSAYGYSRPTTPVLAQLASRGVLFTHAMSPAPWTLPSHASMFTGRWPHELSTDWMWPLDRTYPTIAEALRARGYLTGGFCANVRYCSSETGLARGFAHYEDYDVPLAQALLASPIDQFVSRVQRVLGTAPEEDWEAKSRTVPTMQRAFLAWLDENRAANTGQPFFAFINLFEAHRPYSSPDEFHPRFSTPNAPFTPNLLPRDGPRQPWDASLIRGSQDAYDASIAYLDSEIGHLMNALDRRGVLKNTIVVITSDHGEEFAEHGMIGHGNSVYRASVMVPLIIVAPGLVPADRRVDAAVSTRDVPRTLLGLTRSESAAQFPGSLLSRFWQDSSGGPSPDEPVLSTLRFGPRLNDWYPVSHGPVRSVVDGGWRYIVQQDGKEELYDFNRDALELHNLVTTDSGKVIGARLRTLLDSLTNDGESR